MLRPKLKVWIERHRSLIASALLHAVVIAGLLIVLPTLLTPTSHSDDTRNSISIEIAQLPPPTPAKPTPDVAEAVPILQSPTSDVVLPAPPNKVVAAPKLKPFAAPPVETPASAATDAPPSFIATPIPDASQVANALPAGRAETPSDYLALVQHQFERNKVYPRIARLRGQEGNVTLRFTIDRNGHVLSHTIDRSSGYDALDQATEAMLAHSDPLPPIPSEITGKTVEFKIVIPFELTN